MSKVKINPGIMPTNLNVEVELTSLEPSDLQEALDTVKNEVIQFLRERGLKSSSKLQTADAALFCGAQSFVTLDIDYPIIKASVQVSTPPAKFCPIDEGDNALQYIAYRAHQAVPEKKVEMYLAKTGEAKEYGQVSPSEGVVLVKKDEPVTVEGTATKENVFVKRFTKAGETIWEGHETQKAVQVALEADTDVNVEFEYDE